jgi:putative endonuclease
MEKFFVYILYSKAIDRYYIGHTSNLSDRLKRHNSSSIGFTSRATDWQIIYSEEYATKGEAIKRESQIKRMKSRKFIEELTGHAGGRPD